MKLADLLPSADAIVGIAARTRDGVLGELARALAAQSGGRLQAGAIEDGLAERERERATALGGGIAIPHAKSKDVADVVAVLGRSAAGVEWGAPDGPCHLFFALVAPESRPATHLKALALISKLVRDPDVRARVVSAATADEALRILQSAESNG